MKKSIPVISLFFGGLSGLLIILSVFLPFESTIESLITANAFALWSIYWLLEDRV